MTALAEHTPLYVEFDAQRGKTFRRTVKLYKDDAKTEPLNIPAYGVVLYIGSEEEPAIKLTAGNGLTGDVNGNLVIELTPTQTEDVPDDRYHFHLSVSESEAIKVCPIHGDFTFNPS